jgi:hypothetical protein
LDGYSVTRSRESDSVEVNKQSVTEGGL